MEIGQRFTSQSKVQDAPVEYIFNGHLQNGMIHLLSANGNRCDDIEVFPEWFDNRKIRKIDNKPVESEGSAGG